MRDTATMSPSARSMRPASLLLGSRMLVSLVTGTSTVPPSVFTSKESSPTEITVPKKSMETGADASGAGWGVGVRVGSPAEAVTQGDSDENRRTPAIRPPVAES